MAETKKINATVDLVSTGVTLKLNGGTILSDDGTSHYVHSGSNLYLYSGGSATMTLAAGGNVGIGTTSPQNLLHVYGGNIDTRENNNSSATNLLYFNPTNGNSAGDSNTLGTGITWKAYYDSYTKRSAGIMQVGEGHYFRSGLAFYTNNQANTTGDWSERMRLDMDGNLGIGTASPGYTLEVNGNGRFEDSLSVTGKTVIANNGTMTWGLANDYGQLSWDTGYALYRGQSGKGIKLQVNSSATVMTLTTAGNVGIGTTSPKSMLHVAKQGNANGGSMIIGPTGSGTAKWSYLAGTHYNQDTGSGNGSGSAGVALIGSLSADTYNRVCIGGGPYEINPATEIQLWTYTATTHNLGGTKQMTINSSGEVTFHQYGAGLLQTDANGLISVDTTSYSTFSGDYADLTNKPSIPVSGTDFDPVGTDNSTNVTLVTTNHDYLSLSGQAITLNSINLDDINGGATAGLLKTNASGELSVDTTSYSTFSGDYDDLTNKPTLGTAASAAATDFVAVTGDTMTGSLTINAGDNSALMIANGSQNIAWLGDFGGGTDGQLVLFNNSGTSTVVINGEANSYINGGNLGVGITSPNYKLDVAGDIRINAGNAFTDLNIKSDRTSGNIGGVNFVDGNDAIKGQVYGNADGSVKITSGGTSVAMTIIDGGNVGIGTTSPSGQLQVAGVNPVLIIQDTGGATDKKYRYFQNNDNKLYFSRANDAFNSFSTDMVIDASGNVGIGTTSPGAKLDITTEHTSQIPIRVTHNNYNDWLIQKRRSDDTQKLGIKEVNSNGGMGFATADAVRMVIDSSGNVGIGTTNPGAKTEIQVTSTVDQELLRLTVNPADALGAKPKAILGFYTPAETNTTNYKSGRISSKFDTNGYANSRVTIESLDSSGNFIETLTAKNGKVGIGTTSPSHKLHVVSSGTNQVQIDGSGSQSMFSYSDSGGVGWCTGSGSGNWTNLVYLDTNNDAVNIYANDSFHTTFNAQGRVGIGTTNPQAKLEVNGSVRFSTITSGILSANASGDISVTSVSSLVQDNIYSPKGWKLTGSTYTSGNQNITSSSTASHSGTTPVTRTNNTTFTINETGYYEIRYQFVAKNNYADRCVVGAQVTDSGNNTFLGSRSFEYLRYTTYGEYATIQATFYATIDSGATVFLKSAIRSGSLNYTLDSETGANAGHISFRLIKEI